MREPRTVTAGASPPGGPFPGEAEVTDDVVASRKVSDAVRRLIASLVATSAPSELLEDAADRIETVAASLAPHGASSRYEATAGLSITPGATPVFEHHPFLGPSNPMAPPVTVERGPEQVTARVTFDLRHEGMPGYAHGGWIAAIFDQVLAVAAASLVGRPAMTGTMNIRFVRPTPIDTPLAYVATAEITGARTVRVDAELVAAGEVCARAEGIMVQSKTPRIGVPGGDE